MRVRIRVKWILPGEQMNCGWKGCDTMIIDNSYVHMDSSREYKHFEMKESITLEEREGTEVKLDLSAEGLSLTEQMKQHKEAKTKREEAQQQRTLRQQLQQLAQQQQKNNKVTGMQNMPDILSQEDMELRLLKMIMKALGKELKGCKLMTPDKELLENMSQQMKEGTVQRFSLSKLGIQGAIQSSDAVAVNSSNVTHMVRTTVESVFEAEVENTAFCAQGAAVTADGRSISFDVTLEMSRAFCQKYEKLTQESYVVVDPLVINVGCNTAELTDVKFLFDLDSDGEEEEISFTSEQSGFLVYDKNDDGVINDGAELFGTKSGDGFADLAAYDEDKNGWIDEADEIFSKLKVWTKDKEGNDKLIELKCADVGAIYLGNADTEFTLDNGDATGHNGYIRKTGVYLKESGGAGTIQHVDLVL